MNVKPLLTLTGLMLLVGCQTIPNVGQTSIGSAVTVQEPPIEDITILPISEVTVNPSKPVSMTSVTVPEPDPAPANLKAFVEHRRVMLPGSWTDDQKRIWWEDRKRKLGL